MVSKKGSLGEDKARLLHLIKTRAVEVREEVFVLASGKKSNLYVDLRRITQDAQGINLIGRLVLAKIREIAPNATCIGGLETGSIPIGTSVSLLSAHDDKNAPINAFWVRKKLKDHGMQNRIEGNLAKEATVVMVDDTVTTGGSTMQAIEAVREFGAKVVQVVAIVDRGAAKTFEDAKIPYYAFFSESELA